VGFSEGVVEGPQDGDSEGVVVDGLSDGKEELGFLEGGVVGPGVGDFEGAQI